MSRPLQAQVHLAAVAANYRLARSIGGNRTAAVIKANAYGHGLGAVGAALAGADALAVATIEEAVVLRSSGIGARLLVLEGVFDTDAQAEAAALGLDLVVHSDYQIELLRGAASDARFSVWLKLDTGMGRLGFDPAEAPQKLAALRALPAVADTVLMTHLACADEPNHPHNAMQLARFDRAAAAAAAPLHSVANSAALLGLPAARRQWNRAGVMLFGVNPLEASAPPAPLHCTMTLVSRLIAVREAAAGDSIGYGADFRFEQPGRYGIVACGYGDGYPRHAPTGTPVLVEGHRTRLLGRVSMDMLAVDLERLPQAGVGSPVTLWGAELPVAEVARRAGTIAYELLTGITGRVPRIYDNAAPQRVCAAAPLCDSAGQQGGLTEGVPAA